jgi:hypothetical protein
MSIRKISAIAALALLGVSATAFAATVDVVQAPTGYFVPSGTDPLSSPYYRGYGQDWSWNHNGISGTFSNATLSVSAFDVDYSAPSFTNPSPEVDNIYAWNTNSSTWDLLGHLDGGNNIWSYTTFNLGSSWFDEISQGLKVKIAIDTLDGGWLVSLAKSVVSIDGAPLPNPTPSPVPLPAAAWLFGSALLGFMGYSRKSRV